MCLIIGKYWPDSSVRKESAITGRPGSIPGPMEDTKEGKATFTPKMCGLEEFHGQSMRCIKIRQDWRLSILHYCPKCFDSFFL